MSDQALSVTKLGHSCVRLERGDSRLVIDPGVISEPTALKGAAAVLVTHQHPDHLDVPRLREALVADPGLALRAPAVVVEALGGATEQIAVAAPGQRLEVAGFEVQVVGERHATIHADIPPVSNLGYLVDGAVLHPGDALTVPGVPVDTLLLPVSAPWLKLSEVIDYVRAVRPRLALPIHDGFYTPFGLSIVAMQLGPDGVGIGDTTYMPWSDGDSVSARAD